MGKLRDSMIVALCASIAAVCFYTAGLAKPPDEPSKARSIEIPLDEIWAYSMPGTKDVRELEGTPSEELSIEEQRKRIRSGLWHQIAVSLTADSSEAWPRKGETAGPGFAVLGKGADALKAAYEVLVEGAKPRETFPCGADISIVFVSYQFGSYVHLQEVSRLGDVIRIRYSFVSPVDEIMTAHLALIPIGQLPVGEYNVEVDSVPIDPSSDRLTNSKREWAHRFVSQPFAFEIEEAD